MDYQLIQHPDQRFLEELGRLRAAAWGSSPGPKIRGFKGDVWLDAWDGQALHWAAIDEGRVVAAARMVVRDSVAGLPHGEVFQHFVTTDEGRIAETGRLVVAENYRRRGIARELIRVRLEYARQHKIGEMITIVAGETFCRFLENVGYRAAARFSAKEYPLVDPPTTTLRIFRLQPQQQVLAS